MSSDEKRTVVLKIVGKSEEILTYQNGGKTMSYFNVVGINKEEALHIRVYQKHRFDFLRMGSFYKFTDLLKKGDTCWMVSKSGVGYTGPIPTGTFSQHQLTLPENLPPAGLKRSLAEALDTPQKSTVTGKIIQVSPIKYRREGELAVRSLAIKDQSKIVKVSLFENLAKMSFPENEVVEIISVYQRQWNNTKQLAVTTASKCQFLSSDQLSDVFIKEEGKSLFTDDPDFEIVEDCGIQEFETESVQDIMVYDACSNTACRKKKLKDGTCPICGCSNSQKTARVKLEVKEMESEKVSMVTIFETEISALFRVTAFTSNDSLIDTICQQLPLKFCARLSGGKLHNIIL